MLGMGSMEILVILLVSFLLLGPQKMISGARMMGDLLAEAKDLPSKSPILMLILPISVKIKNGSNLISVRSILKWIQIQNPNHP